jgi:hypothetical protein
MRIIVPATGAVRGTYLRDSQLVTRSLRSPPVAILDSPAKQSNRPAVLLKQPAQGAGFLGWLLGTLDTSESLRTAW